eukprot:TRINITY_DN10542_c0_g1_i1.p1 TRINITY_DN10542_c0_g1~~TRINITY_DN10542_c0_g1_i1.p1  ORF type:complete len:354 (+),score=88.00 TRINITY_DN10542_c0_g1_i1:183-1244(+)
MGKEDDFLSKVEQEIAGLKKKKKGWFASLFKKGDEDDGTDAFGLTEEQRKRFEEGDAMFSLVEKKLAAERRWEEAGKMYERHGKCLVYLGKRSAAATCFISAGNCYANHADSIAQEANKRDLPPEIIAEAQSTINTYLQNHTTLYERGIDEAQCGGYHHQAAGYMVTLSKFVGKRTQPSTYDPEKSVKLMKQAAKVYGNNGEVMHMMDCLVSAATGHQKEGEWGVAAELWWQCAESCTEVTALRMCGVKYGMAFVLCKLAEAVFTTHTTPTTEPLADVQLLDPNFTPTRKESLFLTDITAALAASDPDAFTTALESFKTHTPEPYHQDVITLLRRHLMPDKGSKMSFPFFKKK